MKGDELNAKETKGIFFEKSQQLPGKKPIRSASDSNIIKQYTFLFHESVFFGL